MDNNKIKTIDDRIFGKNKNKLNISKSCKLRFGESDKSIGIGPRELIDKNNPFINKCTNSSNNFSFGKIDSKNIYKETIPDLSRNFSQTTTKKLIETRLNHNEHRKTNRGLVG